MIFNVTVSVCVSDTLSVIVKERLLLVDESSSEETTPLSDDKAVSTVSKYVVLSGLL